MLSFDSVSSLVAHAYVLFYSFVSTAFGRSSAEQVMAHSHTFLVVVVAFAFRHAGSMSFWSPPRGVSFTVVSGSSPTHPPPSVPPKPPPYIFPSPLPQFKPPPSSSSTSSVPQTSKSQSPARSCSPPALLTDVEVQTSPVSLASPASASPPPPLMPARRDPIAPVFDSHTPHELPKYFFDLDFLFTRSHVVSESEMKYHATRLLALDDQYLWESVPEFHNNDASFAQFTAAIFRLYPEADPDRRYSIADLESLTIELRALPSLSRARFLEFYRRFFSISSFLLSKRRLSVPEQSRSFLNAIPSDVRRRMLQRLSIKFPDVHRDDTYPIDAIRDAVDFVLLDTASFSPLRPHSSDVSAPAAIPLDPSISTLRDAISELSQVVSLVQHAPSTSSLTPISTSSPRRLCSYCSDTVHFIAQCPAVTSDISRGFCRRNPEGKVVLPNGTFVPHRINGPDLRSRISIWHKTNSPSYAPHHLPQTPPPTIPPNSSRSISPNYGQPVAVFVQQHLDPCTAQSSTISRTEFDPPVLSSPSSRIAACVPSPHTSLDALTSPLRASIPLLRDTCTATRDAHPSSYSPAPMIMSSPRLAMQHLDKCYHIPLLPVPSSESHTPSRSQSSTPYIHSDPEDLISFL